MRLYVHDSGDRDSDRTAVLIHGLMGAHGGWHAVEAELVAKGYRVLVPDLRGHGESPRGVATPAELADDLVESLPTGVDVAIGHSLGGLALSLAVERLQPARAIYSDPAFVFGHFPPDFAKQQSRQIDAETAASLRVACRRWSHADIRAELAGLASFDHDVLGAFAALGGQDFLPKTAAVPSLVQLADPSTLIDATQADLLRARGFEIVVVPNTGHCIHRDDLAGFMASIEGWI